MQAHEVWASALFNQHQLLIPLWQRRYSWERAEWTALWKDIKRVADGEASNHFVGSVVLKTLPWSGLPHHAHRFWVVDGQQRITTLTILVCAIRDHLARLVPEHEQQFLRESLTAQLLKNKDLASGHQSRLVLQELDQDGLDAIIIGEPAHDRIGDAYRFFGSVLTPLNETATTEVLKTVQTALSAVWVTLEEGDNAHRVFQTLNAGGKPLRQSDLVRNYFFLLLGEEGDDFYKQEWKGLEAGFTPAQIENFFVAWSISQGHDGSKDHLFSYFHKDLSPVEENVAGVKKYGAELVATAKLYSWILNPEGSALTVARPALVTLKLWGTVPFEGLLLHLLRCFSSGSINELELRASFELVISFLARRLMAGFEPNLHKSILRSAAHRLRKVEDHGGAGLVEHLHVLLASGDDVRLWPSDDFILQRVAGNILYTPARAKWVFVILDRVNRAKFDNPLHAPTLEWAGTAPAGVPSYTVEHVMPQSLTAEWVSDLQAWGVANAHALHESRLHVLGNLSITPINSLLSNDPFAKKKLQLSDDWLKVNAEIVGSSSWTESRIDERSRELAKVACTAFVPPMSAGELKSSPWFEGNKSSHHEDPDE